MSSPQGAGGATPNGNPGCCVPAGGTVELNLNCNGITDSATNYVRVDDGASNQCTAYQIDYHY